MALPAVILAGGKGTRLSPYTTILPKPLMPVGEYAVIEILIRRLRQDGIRDITLSVGHLASLMRAYCRDGSQWDVNIEYSDEEKPLGTAGPLGLLPDLDRTLLVLNGDLLTDLSFRELIACHQRHGGAATIGVYERTERVELGIIEADEDGLVRNYIEKPQYRFRVSMGAYVLSPEASRLIPKDEPLDLPDLIKLLISSGYKVGSFLHQGYWLDIGRVDDYRKASDDFSALKKKLLEQT